MLSDNKADIWVRHEGRSLKKKYRGLFLPLHFRFNSNHKLLLHFTEGKATRKPTSMAEQNNKTCDMMIIKDQVQGGATGHVAIIT